MAGRFKSTGTISLNSMDSGNPWIRTGKTKSGDDYLSMNLSVVAAKNNRMYCELFGMAQSKIKTSDTDGNKIEIDWADRKDPEVVKSVANYRKIVINLSTEYSERQEFVSAYDAIKYLEEHEQELKTGTFVVNGQISKNIYNGKISDRFQIQSIYAVDPENSKPGLKITTNFVWDKDSVDVDDFTEDKKVIINGWVSAYIDSNTGNKYVPQQVVLDCSKIDFENETHIAIMKFKMSALGIEWTNGKPKVSLKSGKYYEIPIECNFVNGNEEIQFTEAELTDYQKQQIELGIKKLDDFRPKGSIYGQRVTTYKIVGFDTRDQFADGRVELDDISDEIYVVPTDEKASEVFSGMNPPEEKNDGLEDLFD